MLSLAGVAFIYWPAALIVAGLFISYVSVKIESQDKGSKPKATNSVPAYNPTYN